MKIQQNAAKPGERNITSTTFSSRSPGNNQQIQQVKDLHLKNLLASIDNLDQHHIQQVQQKLVEVLEAKFNTPKKNRLLSKVGRTSIGSV